MKRNTAPEIYVYERSRKKSYGVVKNLLEFSEDIRFNACSEVSFKVPQKVYDTQTEQWVDNQIYDYLEEDKLLYLTDEHEYFRHPVRKPSDGSYYRINPTPIDSAYRNTNTERSFNTYLWCENFSLHPEVELFDIGADSGYSFNQLSEIDATNGSILDYTSRLNTWDKLYGNSGGAGTAFSKATVVSCSEMIPVSKTDVIVLNNAYTDYWDAGGNRQTGTLYDAFSWRVAFYNDESGTTLYNTFSSGNYDDAGYINVVRIPVSDYLPNGVENAFIRVWSDTANTSNQTGETTGFSHYRYGASTYFRASGNSSSWSWKSAYIFPNSGFVKIYSGERFCRYIGLKNVSGYEYPKMHWFVITDTEEENDGICPVKTVTAYSYEYTLQNSTVTIDENTLSLYIPPVIPSIVNNNQRWIVDGYKLGASNPVLVKSAQKMNRGLLNYVLDCLPGWKLGNISQDLMTTYRKIEPVDEANIYSFLTQTIQELYHCFIVFDNDAKTISAYTMKDLLSTWENENTTGSTRSIKLTWDNSIKSLRKDNKDTHTCTALHVNTSDNQYGVGLFNPTGTNVIYNFTPILNEIKYSNPSLYAKVLAWQTAYNYDLINLLNQYKKYRDGTMGILDMRIDDQHFDYNWVKTFVQLNEDCVKYESKVSTALADYRAVVSKINTLLKNNNVDAEYLLSDAPLTSSQISDRSDALCYSAAMKQELSDAAQKYQTANSAYNSSKAERNRILNTLIKVNARKFSVNPLGKIEPGETVLLNRVEREQLADYVKEGNWKDENATFSENYGVTDICSTILDVLSNAWDDLTTRLSIINYDFTVDIANVAAIPKFEQFVDQMYLGLPIYLDTGERQPLTPILLERHIDYLDDDDFAFTFTTDMKRRPLRLRYADLYSTIQQTSVQNNTFTFDT